MTRLTVRETFPPRLLEVKAAAIGQALTGPTLIHLPGRQAYPLFVAVLLHGNETTGLEAVQALLKRHLNAGLPRALSLLVGNVAAAGQGLRRLDGQPDYNRIWPGTELEACAETTLARQVVEAMAGRSPFACVDLHNNTGLNPHYACVSHLQNRSLQLAALFGRLCIHSKQPRGTLMEAFSPLAPTVTLECGRPGQAGGVEHALEFLEAALHLTAFPDHPPPSRDQELYESLARIHVRDGIEFGFGDPERDLSLNPELDHMNFRPLPAGVVWGTFRGSGLPLAVLDRDGSEIGDRYFANVKGALLLKRPMMPAMLTRDQRVIRQDCLGYLMEPVASAAVAGRIREEGQEAGRR